jgi:Leucine-rich repeat (LRR) protein
MTNLKTLGFNGTQITDSGLMHLKNLSNLEARSLSYTKVTDADIAELQKALPDCKISK